MRKFINMESIKIVDLPALLSGWWDVEKTTLYNNEDIRWGVPFKTTYAKAEKKIRAFKVKTPCYSIGCEFDVSGFEYWMKNMKESNYCNFSVYFERDELPVSEIEQLKKDIDKALGFLAEIETQFDYLPEIWGRYEVSDYKDSKRMY